MLLDDFLLFTITVWFLLVTKSWYTLWRDQTRREAQAHEALEPVE